MYYIYILIIVVILLLYHFCWNALKEYIEYVMHMRALPSPKGQPFIGHLTSILVSQEEQFRNIRNWSLEQYPIYKLAVGPFLTVHICGPDEIEAIIASTKHMTKANIYSFLDYWLGEGLLTSSGSKWHLRRKLLTPTFHFGILQKFLNIFNKETHKLALRLQKECDEPHTEINSLISDLTLNTISETSMGYKIDNDTIESKKYRSAIYEMGNVLSIRTQKPWYYFKYPWYISPDGLKETKVIKEMNRLTEKVISNRERDFESFDEDKIEDTFFKRNKMAMLDLLLNAKIKDKLIDDLGIRDEVNTFMFEGHDTTAVSLGFTLMLIANHQHIQAQMVEEMAEKLEDWNLPPTYNELNELKFMERCIKESLRLYPSVPFIARLLDENVTLRQGYVVPKGAQYMIHIYDLHRNPSLWDEPNKFDPDRFLPENCLKRHPFAYIPFSAGPRNCIGQRYAILELKSVLCGILKKFLLYPVDTPGSIELVQDLVLRTKENIKVKFVPRNFERN